MLLETSLKAHNSTKKKFFPKWQDLIVHCLSFSLFSSWVKAVPAHSFHLFPVIKWVWCVLLNSKITSHKLWCFFQLVMHVRKRLGTVCFYFSLVLFNKRGELIICLFQFLAFSFWPHNLNSKKKIKCWTPFPGFILSQPVWFLCRMLLPAIWRYHQHQTAPTNFPIY